MSKLINCECGQVVRGETDAELVRNAVTVKPKGVVL
jgi:hypothetical protein